jgi:type III pantothenate kinase
MPNLLIEIGNTALKAAWAEEMTLGKMFRYQGEKVIEYIVSLTEKERPEVMVIASAQSIGKEEENILKKACGKLILLDSEKEGGIFMKYHIPEYLSPDRAASVIAARYLFKGKGCLIFDFGATLTIDVVEQDGEYSGGNISLGFRTRFQALNRYSRNLPLADPPAIIRQVGDSVETAIQSGVVSGIMFELQGYLSLFPEKIVVFTGGDANYFAKKMKNAIFVVCNLVLMGLALIAEEYEQDA